LKQDEENKKGLETVLFEYILRRKRMASDYISDRDIDFNHRR
jgi:hypothetical protein